MRTRAYIARRPAPDVAKIRAQIVEDAREKIEKIETERDGLLWLLDHSLPRDNAIYYGHTRRWAFGWRKPLTDALKSRLLDALSEFPYDYDIVTPK